MIPNQELGLSTNEPGENFVTTQFDGILSLSYPSISAGRDTQQHDLTKPNKQTLTHRDETVGNSAIIIIPHNISTLSVGCPI